ncbi:MAG: M20/M25/M40 family metallo-hydrolase [Eubacteriales bacterium]|nr:M20/M25/M40 family metallo-hydrolase [Eubacteriales bacterium]
MDKWYKGYEDHANFRYFDDILQIPRGSFHEERISDYIEEKVKASGLDYTRNKLGDFIIKMPASKGRESEAPLVVQAHTDMVCMKTPESTHDFTKDPIRVYAEDGWLRTFGTTLGADDGAGLAMILGLIEDRDTLSNPPLELVLTVQEEDGMGGAKGLDFSQLSAKRMIGLDGLTLGTTAFSASAVDSDRFRLKITPEALAGQAYKVSVSGLRSGHGGNNIGDGLGNAIKIAGRVAYYIDREVGVRFASINGGTMVHTIPPMAELVFKSAAAEAEVRAAFEKIAGRIREQQRTADPDMELELVKADDCLCVSETESRRIIDFLFAVPCGAQKRAYGHQERILSSYNISTSRTSNSEIVFDYVCRANMPEDVKELYDAAVLFAEKYGMEYERVSDYDGHTVDEDSPLTLIYEKVYTAKYPGSFIRMFMHAGLDAGTIFTAKKMNDFIVMMPDVKDVHMPSERMNLQKFAECYDMLKEVLSLC